MIYQTTPNDHTENQFFHALKELQIAKLFRKANITKSCDVSAYEVFQFLLLLVFQGKNLFRFLILLAVKVTSAFDRLPRPERVNVLILDDSVIKRNRSKNVELLARVYDHVEHKFRKSFTLLISLQNPATDSFPAADFIFFHETSCMPWHKKDTCHAITHTDVFPISSYL